MTASDDGRPLGGHGEFAALTESDHRRVSRGIRLGRVRTVRRGCRLVVPVSEVMHLLNAPGSAP